jgi:hypothetical protein
VITLTEKENAKPPAGESEGKERTFGGLPHSHYENDSEPDPYPERRYDAETQKEMEEEDAEDEKFVRELRRQRVGKGGNYLPDDDQQSSGSGE